MVRQSERRICQRIDWGYCLMLNQLVQERLGQLELERLQLVATISEKDKEIANLKAEIEKLKADNVDNESEE